MDVLFQKWWQSALVRPVEHGIMRLCVLEESFDKTLKLILKILKAILYGKLLEDTGPATQQYNNFISSKKYLCNIIII